MVIQFPLFVSPKHHCQAEFQYVETIYCDLSLVTF